MKGPQTLDYMYIYARLLMFSHLGYLVMLKKGGDVVMSSLGPDPHRLKERTW
jgi:hypothetical protein